MVFVVGVGRTGTSMVARVLEERLGVDMGGPGEVCEGTPDGSWEDEEFLRINWKLASGEIGHDQWVKKARALGAKRKEPWGMKHPLLAEAMPLVLRAFPDATVIWCQRDAVDTWQSWLRHFQMDPENAWIVVNYRHWSIAAGLMGRQHISVDTTARLDEEEVARALGEGIETLAPGTLHEPRG